MTEFEIFATALKNFILVVAEELHVIDVLEWLNKLFERDNHA
jgi:hypothetical protein